MSGNPVDGDGTVAGSADVSTAEAAGTAGAAEAESSEGVAGGGTYGYGTTVIARTVTRVVVPLILVTAVALLLQGHNLPGGGFIAGVLTTTAFVLVYVIFGLDFLRAELLGRGTPDGDEHAPVAAYRLTFAVGLALAAGAGLAPAVWGRPFLTQGVLFLEGLPLYGTLEVASALAFDLGVYLTVVGALLTVVGEVGSE